MRRWLALAISALVLSGCPSTESPEKDAAPRSEVQADVQLPVDTFLEDTAGPGDTTAPVDTTSFADTIATDAAEIDTAEPPPVEDTTPPVWPESAALQASAIEKDRLTLSWPHATDDTWVAGYVVTRNGIPMPMISAMETSTKLLGLDEATTYKLSVSAKDKAGNMSTPIELVVQTGDVTLPTWPQGGSMSASQITDTGATLSWTAAQDNVAVTHYDVLFQGEVLATTNAPTLELTELTPWTELSLSVIAKDGAGNISAPGPSVSFKTTDTEAPVWPEGAALSTSDLKPSSVTLSWPEATDKGKVASYQVRKDKAVIAATDSGTTNASIIDLDPAATHTFSIWAIDMAGNVSAEGPKATISTVDTSAPTWPDGASLIASNVTPSALKLAWTPASDDVQVTAYHVHQNGKLVHTVATTQVDIAGLGPWKNYDFNVLAEDGAGNMSIPGPSTSVKTPDTTHPTWPEGATLEVSNLTPHTLTLSWPQAVDDVSITEYRVHQGDVELAILGPEMTSFDVEGLSPWTDLSFRVSATDQAGNMTADELEATAKTPDEVAPEWGAGALVATKVEPASLTLTWPEVTDDVGVTSIRVMMDGDELATVGPEVTTFEVVDLSPWTDYSFSVTAQDAAENTTDTLETSLKTPDKSLPSWPADAALEMVSLTAISATLAWPKAQDDVEISSYTLRMGEEVIASLGGDTTEVEVTDLSPWTEYSFSLVASDPAGNVSAEPLTAELKTPDGGPPTWPADAALTTEGVAPKNVVLVWTAATDDVEVTEYRVYQDGVLLESVAGTKASVEGLTPETTYTFSVQAGDPAGNWSEDGPTITVTTPLDLWTNEMIYEGLKPTCMGCHMEAQGINLPYFASLEVFENTLVYDPKYVVPQDPDASLLIKLLEGTAPPETTKMPPGIAYIDLKDPILKIEDVRKWIEFMPKPPVLIASEPGGPFNERKRLEQIQNTLFSQLGIDNSDFAYVGTKYADSIPCMQATMGKDRTFALIRPDDFYQHCGGTNWNYWVANLPWFALGGPHFRARVKRSQDIDMGFLLRLTQVTKAHCRIAVQKDGNTAVLKHATLADTVQSAPQAIRDNIAYLHLRLLGEVATAEQIDDLFDLFDTYASGVPDAPVNQNDLTTVGWTAVCSTLLRSPLWLTY